MHLTLPTRGRYTILPGEGNCDCGFTLSWCIYFTLCSSDQI